VQAFDVRPLKGMAEATAGIKRPRTTKILRRWSWQPFNRTDNQQRGATLHQRKLFSKVKLLIGTINRTELLKSPNILIFQAAID